MRNPTKFDPFDAKWPDGLESKTLYRIPCDDSGEKAWLQVLISDGGDAHASMCDTSEFDSGSPVTSLRIRTRNGGGMNWRTRQALLWLAQAIRLDNLENGRRGE